MAGESDNLTPRNGDDADWARWEQKFRAAVPVLPEAAMRRIEASVRRAADKPAKPGGNGRWVVLGIVLAGLIGVSVLFATLHHRLRSAKNPAIPTTVPAVVDHYQVPPPPQSQVHAPDRPVLPLDPNRDLIEPVHEREGK